MVIILIVVILVLMAIWIAVSYNKFISLSERVDNAKAQISTQIESRWDAIKSLIDATKSYSQHENTLLRELTESRIRLGANSTVGEIEEDNRKLEGIMGKLIAVSEAYPDLKANQVYENTMNSIRKFEDNVRHSRMIYNDVVNR